MQVTDIPIKVDVVWGKNAAGAQIRQVPDTTSDPNAASWSLGFPPNTFVDPGAGGEPPDGRDVNGAYNALSKWIQWLNAGGPLFYDAAFSATIGGYPKWAQLDNAATPGLFWISLVNNNTSDPDTGGANWLQFPPAAAASVTSFNGRTGAVTLTSSDVVSALATNALPLNKIATIPGQTIMGNDGGGGATMAPLSQDQALDVLGFSGNVNVAFFPQNNGQILVRQWGTHAAVAPNSNTPISFAQSMTTPFGVSLTTHSDGTGFHNCVAMLVDGTLTSSGFTANMQNFAAGGGAPNQAFNWEAWGYQ